MLKQLFERTRHINCIYGTFNGAFYVSFGACYVDYMVYMASYKDLEHQDGE